MASDVESRSTNSGSQKAANRSKKLTQLKVQGPARGKAAKAGVESAAAYGHQAVGLAPKRMKFLRQLAASHNGRPDQWLR